ncbi:hypothetical protein [Pseudomonas fontis]|uniref:Uncharacterized protein n=1 Tax=Pseudomonas fontis TaxID=2942633 RepID=A0ABT5P028_9PSED|nr:hypothetical protein [Pseudomonas fontis]MDD0972956.1 hypothetical protein [Pseudomonas fontis]MDD0993810.1 hypothetical protein [Pseudomonas fontis]
MSHHLEKVKNKNSTQAPTKPAILSLAYFARAVATVTLSAAEIGTAVAIAKPFFDHLAQAGKTGFAQHLGKSLGHVAGRLGTQASRLLLARLVLGAFWIGLAITIIILIFDDDALEKWCNRCAYRLDKSSKPYSDGDELPALFSAFREVT